MVRAHLVKPLQLMRYGISAGHAPSSGHFSLLAPTENCPGVIFPDLSSVQL